jgi:CheY-like chemotaxis protein
VFELWLPLADAAALPDDRAARHAPALLYIEDNDVNMLIVRELLTQRPRVAFHGAPDGASGVRLARELRPSLILIDMQLPDIDGTEVLRRLRADPVTASVRCIALSANAMPEDVASARAAGFDDYWTKPIDLTAFLRAVDALIGA